MLTTALCALAMAQQDSKPELPPVQMGQAQLCFLVEPGNPPKLTEKEESEKQAAHLKFLQGLWEKRTALVVGPLRDAGRRRGIVLLDVGSSEEAKKVMAADPFVSTGALELETHTWFFAKNYVKKGGVFMSLQNYWFGMLERPEKRPDYTKEELEKMQEGHMANINKMGRERALLLAGPMMEDTPFRGIFVFKNITKEKIDELTAVDPYIKAGRLKLTVFRWLAAKGSFLAED